MRVMVEVCAGHGGVLWGSGWMRDRVDEGQGGGYGGASCGVQGGGLWMSGSSSVWRSGCGAVGVRVEVGVWRLGCGAVLTVFLSLPVFSFSPTDNKFATCSDDGTVRIWDFMRCHEERILRGQSASHVKTNANTQANTSTQTHQHTRYTYKHVTHITLKHVLHQPYMHFIHENKSTLHTCPHVISIHKHAHVTHTRICLQICKFFITHVHILNTYAVISYTHALFVTRTSICMCTQYVLTRAW